MHLLHFSFHVFSGHPLSPPSFSCHSIPFSISLQFSFPSSPSASFLLLHPPFLLPCMCKRRVEGVRDGGKAFACRKFFSPSVLTCSPAGQHILSTSVGLAGQAEPYLLSPPLPSRSLSPGSYTDLSCWSRVVAAVVGGKLGRHFQLNHTFQRFPPACVFQVLFLSFLRKSYKEEKVLNINICGTPVTWVFPFQTLDLCLPAKTQDTGWSRREGGGRDRCGQSGKSEDRTEGKDGEHWISINAGPLWNMSASVFFVFFLSHVYKQRHMPPKRAYKSFFRSWDKIWRVLTVSVV